MFVTYAICIQVELGCFHAVFICLNLNSILIVSSVPNRADRLSHLFTVVPIFNLLAYCFC